MNNSEIVKSGYINQQKLIDAIPDEKLYTKEKLSDVLLKDNLYKKYFGKTKNRTMKCDSLILYKSLYKHTDILIDIFKSKKHMYQLSHRILFVVKYNYDTSKLRCKCGKTYNYSGYCRHCKPTYPSKEYFKYKYSDDWELYMNKTRKKRKAQMKGVLTAKWFKKKYGEKWYQKYYEHYGKILGNSIPYSKISQELFFTIINKLKMVGNNDIYFAEHGGEYIVGLKKEEYKRVNQTCFFLDFVLKKNNKIYNIEFDGDYWHNKNDNNLYKKRDLILKEKGINILRILESDYYVNKEKTVHKCLEFLND